MNTSDEAAEPPARNPTDASGPTAGEGGEASRRQEESEIVWFRRGAEEMVVDVSGTDDPRLHLSAARYRRLADLRERFGRPLWLTLVSTVFAGAYRRAGMTGEEVGDLFFADDPDRTGVSLSLRRNPNLRLLRALGGTSGAVHRAGGLHCAFFHAGIVTYRDWNRTLQLRPSLMRHPLQPGGPGSRVGDVFVEAPASLADMTVAEVRSDGHGHHIKIDDYWESLLPMPDGIADELGFRRQDHLGDLSWLDDLRSPPA